MCMSRLNLVVRPSGGDLVTVEDVEGYRHDVSLLAYEGTPPQPGDWLVVHSGFALARAEPEEAMAVLAELGASGRTSQLVTDAAAHEEEG
jgi:hydrogenase maturation factor